MLTALILMGGSRDKACYLAGYKHLGSGLEIVLATVINNTTFALPYLTQIHTHTHTHTHTTTHFAQPLCYLINCFSYLKHAS